MMVSSEGVGVGKKREGIYSSICRNEGDKQ